MDPITALLDDLLDEIRPMDDGAPAAYIPELAAADPDRLAFAVVGPRGRVRVVGDGEHEFTIQSISKPFVLALALEECGRERVLECVGVEPSGEPFNAISLAHDTGRPANPMVNAGAIATTALVGEPESDIDERTARIVSKLSAFAGRSLWVDEAVYASESATGDRNRALGHLLRSYGVMTGSVEAAVETYFRQCSLLVTVRDLAVMAGTLAFGGVNPVTGVRVVSTRVARDVLSIMSSCGMYDYSGEWLLRVGLPAKSGVSGGLLAVAPSQFGVAAFSPRLDAHGNSVRAIAAVETCRTASTCTCWSRTRTSRSRRCGSNAPARAAWSAWAANSASPARSGSSGCSARSPPPFPTAPRSSSTRRSSPARIRPRSSRSGRSSR